MQEINFIADKLDEIRRDLGISNYSGFLDKTREKIVAIANDSLTHLDIYYCSTAVPAIRKFAAALPEPAPGNDIILHVQTEQSQSSRIFAEMMPAIAVLLVDEDFIKCLHLNQLIEQRAQQYRFVLLIDFMNNEPSLKQIQKIFSRANVKTIAPIAPEEKPPLLQIKEQLLPGAVVTLNKIAKVNSVAPLQGFLQDIIQSENVVIQTKKLLTAQQGNIIRKEEQQTSTNELSSNLKMQVQKVTSDLEKHYRGKYEELNKPNIGKFSVLINEESSKLEDFTREIIAEKSEKVLIKIDQKFQNKFLKSAEANIREQFSQDEKYVQVVMDGLIADINNEFASRGIKKVKPDDLTTTFTDPTKILSAYNTINKPFQGEIIKKGISEYFVALRDYTGLIMVVAGILAPLNTISAVAQNAFLKSIATGVRVSTGVITLLMVVYGIYDLRKRIPKKRKEEFDREMGKAREALNQEGKRIYNDCSKDWQNSLGNWVREAGTKIISQIEQNLKQSTQERVQQVVKVKSDLQRFQQSVDMTLKNFSSAEKSKDQVIQKLRDTASTVEKELKF